MLIFLKNQFLKLILTSGFFIGQTINMAEEDPKRNDHNNKNGTPQCSKLYSLQSEFQKGSIRNVTKNSFIYIKVQNFRNKSRGNLIPAQNSSAARIAGPSSAKLL